MLSNHPQSAIFTRGSAKTKINLVKGRQMKTFLAVCMLLVFASGVVNAANKQKFSEKDVEKLLIESSKKINAQLPTMVDADTRLDTTMVIGNQMHYKYTMINAFAKDINKKATTKELRSMLVANQCSTDNMLKLLKMGVSYHYMYQDKNGIIISTIKISEKDCGL